MPVNKICEVCGKGFSVPPSRALTAKACSHECAVSVRGESKKRQVTLACKNCGKAFSEAASHVTRRVFCSRECQHANAEHREQKSESRMDSKNPMWKGGVVSQSEGYLYEKANGHPFASGGNGSYVLQHRLIAERHLRAAMPDSKFLIEIDGQKYLRREIEVHHVDRNRANNEVDNLVVCTSEAHKDFHCGRQPAAADYWLIAPI